EREVIELPFQLGLFDLEAFKFLEQEFAVAFRGGELLFFIGDIFLQTANARCQIGGFLVKRGLLGLQLVDAGVAFGHFGFGGIGSGLGFSFGLGQLCCGLDQIVGF